jgi:hypothetical protein
MKKLRTIDLLNKILNKEKVGTQYKNTYNGEILDTKNSSNINLESLLNPYLQDTNKRIGWFENYLLEEWEEVEEPVTFMDAMVEHFKKHKTIYCLIDSKKYTYPWRGGEYKEMKSNEGGSLCAKEILEGKWYIEP